MFKDRTGEINYNKYNNLMMIEKYVNYDNIIVNFKEFNYKTNTSYESFKKGIVKSPYDKEILNIGYIGIGKYKPTKNGKSTKQYSCWRTMLKRCYDKKHLKKYPTYIGCTVCSEWHNFQNFGKWYDNNYYQIDNEVMCLDKDILIKGNKIYSPETCVFVPQSINKLFTKNDSKRGNLPIGVFYDDKLNMYIASYSRFNKKTQINEFNSYIDAFNSYKSEKEKYIKEVADKYKNHIPKNLYDAMYQYVIKITD